MTLTKNVIQDLLPVYLAGEASADTVSVVEEFLRLDPDFARTVEALRATPLPEPPIDMQPTKEKETLEMTKQLLWWRGILMGLAVFLTLLPMTFTFGHDQIRWTFLQEAPPVIAGVICLGAVTCWGGFFYVRRRLRSTGL